jgi:hypothetical protein
MDALRDEPANPEGKGHKLTFIVGGMAILGMLALIALVLYSSFPGPPHGSPDKTEAPQEDVSKAKP